MMMTSAGVVRCPVKRACHEAKQFNLARFEHTSHFGNSEHMNTGMTSRNDICTVRPYVRLVRVDDVVYVSGGGSKSKDAFSLFVTEAILHVSHVLCGCWNILVSSTRYAISLRAW